MRVFCLRIWFFFLHSCRHVFKVNESKLFKTASIKMREQLLLFGTRTPRISRSMKVDHFKVISSLDKIEKIPYSVVCIMIHLNRDLFHVY